MNPATNPWLLCPFCGGTAQRIREEKRDSPSMLAELGLALTTEVVFWAVISILAAAFLWSLVAGVVAVALGGLAGWIWHWWQPRHAAYRCETCRTVLAFQEMVMRHERAV